MIEEIEELEEKFVTKEQMQEIEIYNLKIKEKDYIQSILNMRIKLLEAEIHKVRTEIKEVVDKKENIKSKLQEFTDELKKELGIEASKFGYDPITGEVKL